MKFEDMFETKSVAFCCGMILSAFIIMTAIYVGGIIVDGETNLVMFIS